MHGKHGQAGFVHSRDRSSFEIPSGRSTLVSSSGHHRYWTWRLQATSRCLRPSGSPLFDFGNLSLTRRGSQVDSRKPTCGTIKFGEGYKRGGNAKKFDLSEPSPGFEIFSLVNVSFELLHVVGLVPILYREELPLLPKALPFGTRQL